MKTLITSEQAFINQLQRAVENGFEIDRDLTINEIQIEAQDFLIYNLPVDKSEYCEVLQHGTSQHVDYCDGLGTVYTCDGEIIGWNTYRDATPNEKFVHTTIVNVKGEIVQLYENLCLSLS
jgi:hypothetical protein